VSDLELRLGLYRRLSGLESQDQVEGFAAEMIDRFGPLPEEVEHLMQIVAIKLLCRRAGIASVDAGPKGVVLRFRKDTFANPAGLVQFIGSQGKQARLRPDHRLVLMRDWETAEERLKGSFVLLRQLARLAEEAASAAA
jgi:transcription-repair coupling factor (superfamily II helicase)